MKIKFLPFWVGSILSTSAFFSSCLDNEIQTYVFPEETSISSFSIGTVSVERPGKDSLGKDTIFIDTINCERYPFSIDQLTRTIENKDSLPVGSNVSKVQTKISADTELITYAKKSSTGEDKDTIWTPQDSIDFTRPVYFTIHSRGGHAGRAYKVTVNVHKQHPNVLAWSHFANTNFASTGLTKQKAVALNQRIYVFGINSEGTPVAESMAVSDGKISAWESAATLPANTVTYSAQAWKGNVYFVADKKLYKLTTDGSTVQVGNLANLKNLAGTGKTTAATEVLFALNENQKIVALDENGNKVSNAELEFIGNQAFETDRLYSVTYPARHNASLTRTLVMSNNPHTAASDTTAYLYNYTTNDTKWNKYTMVNPKVCPNLENISLIYYDNKLYAFGGGLESMKIKPFEAFYCSTDNGLSWIKVLKDMTFPKEEAEGNHKLLPFANYYTANEEGSYSTVVDADKFIWLIWKDGSMTRGRINRLGFAPKW